MREKYCWLANKPWLKTTGEHAKKDKWSLSLCGDRCSQGLSSSTCSPTPPSSTLAHGCLYSHHLSYSHGTLRARPSNRPRTKSSPADICSMDASGSDCEASPDGSVVVEVASRDENGPKRWKNSSPIFVSIFLAKTGSGLGKKWN